MGHPMVFVFPRKLAHLLLARLERFAFGVHRPKRDPCAIGTPIEGVDPVGQIGELLRLSAVCAHPVQLIRAGSIGKEDERSGIRRPLRVEAGTFGVRERKRLPALARDPDLPFVAVVLPVGLGDDVGETAAVGGKGYFTRRLQAHQLVDGGGLRRERSGGDREREREGANEFWTHRPSFHRRLCREPWPRGVSSDRERRPRRDWCRRPRRQRAFRGRAFP